MIILIALNLDKEDNILKKLYFQSINIMLMNNYTDINIFNASKIKNTLQFLNAMYIKQQFKILNLWISNFVNSLLHIIFEISIVFKKIKSLLN